MDIGRAIQYWTNDPSWIKKVLIGGLISLIPIVGGMMVYGYLVRTARQVMSGVDSHLPEWDQFGDDLVRGFKILVIFLIWTLPIVVLSFCIAFLGLIDETVGSVVSILFGCFVFLYYIALLLAIPIIIARFARTEQIGEGLQFAAIIQDFQKVASHILIFVLVALVVNFVASFGILLCFIGVVFTGFIAMLIYANMIAQIASRLGYSDPQQSSTAPPPPAM